MSDVEPGTANERTELAWQRTSLSLLGGSAVITRLTFDRLGSVALLALVVGLPLSVWVLLESRMRYVRDAGIRPATRPRGGVSPAALTVGTVVVAGVELAALLR